MVERAPTRGLTLGELLVVVAITAVLAAVLFPAFHRPHGPGYQLRAGCRSNLKQIGAALLMYARDYDDRFPPHAYAAGAQSVTIPSLLHPYLRNPSIWQCPKDRKNQVRHSGYDGSAGDSTVGYGYNWCALSPNGRGVHLDQVNDPGYTLALTEATSHAVTPATLVPAFGGTAPLYRHERLILTLWVDGHVKFERPGKLEDTTPEPATGNGIDAFRYWNLR